MLPCPGKASRLCLRVVGSGRSSCLVLPGKGGEEKEEGELEHECIWGHELNSRAAGRAACRRGAWTRGCVCVCAHKGHVFIA